MDDIAQENKEHNNQHDTFVYNLVVLYDKR